MTTFLCLVRVSMRETRTSRKAYRAQSQLAFRCNRQNVRGDAGRRTMDQG
jgi:hypothetical protein